MSKGLLKKLLFIEDDEAFFNVIKRRLQKEGFFVIRAKDGDEGVKKAKIEMPEIVLVDIVMPKLNGFEVIKILREKPITNDLKVIILSNYGETALVYDREFQKTLGVEKYLIKSEHTPTEIAKEVLDVCV